MLVTAITSQKKRKDRFNIFLDGTFAFALDSDILIKYQLKLQQKLTANEISQILKDGEISKWKNKVLEYLSRRPRSQKEIADYLRSKEVGKETTHIVTSELEQKNLINDREFALWFVEQRKTFRPKGARIIRSELRQKGIADETISEVLEETMTQTDEIEQAVRLAQKKLRHTVLNNDLKAKLQRYLAQRGYSWDTVKAVFERLHANED